MLEKHEAILSVAALFAERAARLSHEKEAEAKLRQQENEREKEFEQKLDTFEMTDAVRQSFSDKIKRAFDRGEAEVVLVSFPVSFCTDDGRAVANSDVPPINKPAGDKAKNDAEPAWLATVPRGAHAVYEFWKTELKPGGFGFGARVTDFPGGKPGHIALFFSWPKDPLDVPS